MTSTITLYKLPQNILGKNNQYDSWSTYLSNVSSSDKSIISNFQYIKIQLEVTIKLNMAQSSLPYSFGFNYVSIVQDSMTYYFLIKKARQIAESTIELELHMDVLNTYQFNQSGTAGNTYTLLPSTLVTREHKDRFYLPTYNKLVRNVGVIIGAGATKTYTGNIFEIADMNVGIDDITITYVDPLVVNVTNVTGTLVTYTVTNPTDTLFNRIIDIRYQVTFKTYLKKIDKYPENIPVQLFKQSESDLKESGDEYYILFQNENNVVTHDSDTSPLVVNPVKTFIISSARKSITTQVATSKTINCVDIPNVVNKKDILCIAYAYNDGSDPQITISGTTYTLKAPNQTTYNANEYNMILFIRGGAYDETFQNIYAYRFTLQADGHTVVRTITSIGGSNTISSFNVIHVNYGMMTYSALPTFPQNDVIYSYSEKGTPYEINSGASSVTETIKSYSDVDLTNPKNIKMFNVPYSPQAWFVEEEFTSLPDNFAINSNFVEVLSLNNVDFTRTLNFRYLNPIDIRFGSISISESAPHTMERNIYRETKLYHSDYYVPKFVYDSFTFNFMLETIDLDEFLNLSNKTDFEIDYAVTKAIASRFLFAFPQYVCGSYETQDYNNILIVDRNNEVQLFNNAYMNYMKLGYQFDTKSIQRQQTGNVIGTALAITGALASFISSAFGTGGAGIVGGVSLMTTAIGSTTRAIVQAQQQDASMSQKLLAIQNQSESVAGNSDLDIMRYYTNLRPKLVFYTVSDVMKQALYNLFYYCGYATREYKVPSITSRINFNFVQAEVNFKCFEFSEEIGNEIKAKWKEGITFFHTYNGTYDFNQEYENWESSLMS